MTNWAEIRTTLEQKAIQILDVNEYQIGWRSAGHSHDMVCLMSINPGIVNHSYERSVDLPNGDFTETLHELHEFRWMLRFETTNYFESGRRRGMNRFELDALQLAQRMKMGLRSLACRQAFRSACISMWDEPLLIDTGTVFDTREVPSYTLEVPLRAVLTQQDENTISTFTEVCAEGEVTLPTDETVTIDISAP